MCRIHNHIMLEIHPSLSLANLHVAFLYTVIHFRENCPILGQSCHMLLSFYFSVTATPAEYFFLVVSANYPKNGSDWPDLGPLLINEPTTLTLNVHSFGISLPLGLEKSQLPTRISGIEAWTIVPQRNIKGSLLKGGKINSRQTEKLISTLPSVIL